MTIKAGRLQKMKQTRQTGAKTTSHHVHHTKNQQLAKDLQLTLVTLMVRAQSLVTTLSVSN